MATNPIAIPCTSMTVRNDQLNENRRHRRAGDDDSRAMFRALIDQLRPMARAAAESGFSEQDFIDAARSAY